ncbi:hypothetical protein GF337_01705 [candidate division KSB1 bacterium]|nr:hypothetical protein [candidate division KSB1 bacterium]
MKSDTENISVKVNDENVPMNPFVKEVTKNVILGLIRSLKIKAKPERISIEIDLYGSNNF